MVDFSNAYFGEIFYSRNGCKAVFLGQDPTDPNQYRLMIEGHTNAICYNKNGTYIDDNVNTSKDIVGNSCPTESINPTNIFEGAKFGDRFKTRDGRMAIFDSTDGIDYFLIVQNSDVVCYKKNGEPWWKDNSRIDYKDYSDFDNSDIVSVWTEDIDEERLNDIAKDVCSGLNIRSIRPTHEEIFKRGFKEAMKYGYGRL